MNESVSLEFGAWRRVRITKLQSPTNTYTYSLQILEKHHNFAIILKHIARPPRSPNDW